MSKFISSHFTQKMAKSPAGTAAQGGAKTQQVAGVRITTPAASPFMMSLELQPPVPKWAKGLKQAPGPYKKDAEGRFIYDINGMKIPEDGK